MHLTEPVETLKAFKRSTEDVDSPVIQYPALEEYAAEAKRKESTLWDEFWNAEEGSVSEEDRARALARGYLVLTSLQMQQAAERHRTQVSTRFTEAAVEMYGQPDEAEVRRLAAKQHHNLAKLVDNPEVDQSRLASVMNYLERQLGGVPAEAVGPSEDLSEALSKTKSAFEARFGNALAVFDGLDFSQEEVPAAEAKRLFEEAKELLAQDEPAWNQQRVILTDKKSMGYDDKENAIGIGEKGSYSPKRLKRLFIEEALVHGLRAVNGAKTGDYMMQHGLPDYLDAEEGLAKFIQVAMGDELGERSEDFYMDTAFALGELDQPAISRPELVSLYMDKMIVRAQARHERIDEAKLKDTAWRYANRIYRGSLGNHHIGVNPKDIAYYHGYLLMGRYIKAQLEAGVSPDELLDYLLCGKFDPTNERHADYVSQHRATG